MCFAWSALIKSDQLRFTAIYFYLLQVFEVAQKPETTEAPKPET